MPESPRDRSSDTPVDTVTSPGTDFGANEWLVEEMYEAYQRDPSSVDEAWHEYFAAQGKPNGTAPAKGSSSGKPGAKPAAKASSPEQSPDSAEAPVASGVPAAERRPASSTTDAAAQGDSRTEVEAKAAKKTAGRNEKAAAGSARPTTPPVPKQPASTEAPEAPGEPEVTPMRGAPARTAKNMDISLSVPTATSVRNIPVKLLIDNRTVINNPLARARGGKVSFTHIIGFALVRALSTMPEMNVSYDEVDGKPHLVTPPHVNLGLAIDQQKSDGTRQLLVPSIKAAEAMDFAQFWTAYEDIVRKARNNKLTVADFQGTTVSLTNPGTIGTSHSVPRLMKGQGAIIGVGSMDYPPEFQGASQETLTRNAVSRVLVNVVALADPLDADCDIR